MLISLYYRQPVYDRYHCIVYLNQYDHSQTFKTYTKMIKKCYFQVNCQCFGFVQYTQHAEEDTDPDVCLVHNLLCLLCPHHKQRHSHERRSIHQFHSWGVGRISSRHFCNSHLEVCWPKIATICILHTRRTSAPAYLGCSNTCVFK